MAEDANKQQQQVQQAPMQEDYIKVIEELKSKSVNKEDYDKLLDENRKLLKSLVENKPLQTEEPQKQKIDKTALRKELYGSDADLSNLDYVQKTLTLRKAIMDDGEPDPFVGRGEKLVPDDSDYAAAAKVASVLEHCVEYANGDSEVFTNELQRLTNDIPLPKRRK